MAVTRINNNQITDASSGNAAAGINATTKIQDYTVTAGKLANNITYGSDFTITGNLAVQGATTQINTDIVTVEDPLLILASNQAAAPALDIGFIGQRGTSENIAFVWDESAGQFVTAFTSTAESNTTITITTLANFATANANVGGTLEVVGTTSLVGNIISGANITGNLTSANVFTPGSLSATGLVSGGNISTTGNVDSNAINTVFANIGNASVTGNVNSANLNVGPVTVLNSGAISGVTTLDANANITTTGNVVANGVYANTYYTANGTPISTNAAGSNTQVQYNAGGNNEFGASSAFTFDYAAGANLLTAGNITSSGALSAVGTATVGNVATAGTVSATGLVTGGNFDTAGNVNATGNVIATGHANAAAVTVTSIANTSVIFANTVGGLSADATFTYNYAAGAELLSVANVSATGTVTSAHAVVTDIANTQIVFGNVANGLVGNSTLTFDSTTGNLNVPIVYASGNVTGNAINAVGDLFVGAIANVNSLVVRTTANIVGNIDGSNINLSGIANVVGNLNAGNISTGNLSAANIDITTVNTSNITSANTLTLTANGAITLNAQSGAAPVSFSNSVLSQVATPQSPTDAANKGYVDSVVQGLDLKASCELATTTALDAITDVTNVVYNNGAAGVGATLTISSSANVVIDGTNISTLTPGTRILIKNESLTPTATTDAAWNGIYVLNGAGPTGALLTRSTDTDDEGTTGQLPGAFTFISTGVINADTGYVCSTNNPIVMGTTPIIWTQFSAAGVYTAGAGLELTGTQFSVQVDNVTTSINGAGTNGQVIVKTSALFTTPQLGAATFDSFTANLNTGNGNITANGILLDNNLSAVGTVTGNLALFTAGQVSANTATVTSLGNIGVIYSNATGGLQTDAVDFNYNPVSKLLTVTNVDSAGNIAAANVRVTTLGNAQVVYANATGGLVSDSVFTYDVATGNLGTANITATATVKGTDGTFTSLGNTEIVFANAAGGLQGTTDFVFDPAGSGNVTVTGNVAAGNFTTGGLVSAAGNVTGGNIITLGNIDGANVNVTGLVSVIGNVNSANLNVGPVSILNAGNITGVTTLTANANISTTGNIVAAYFWGDGSNITGLSTSASNIANGTSNVEIFTANGNVTFGVNGTNNVLVVSDTFTTAAGNLSAVGNVSANNVSATNGVTANTVTGITSGTFGNVTIIGAAIESNAGTLVINGASSANDFAVNGTAANVLYVNGTTNTVSIGSNAQVTNAILALNSTTSFVVPVGNTTQRPAVGVTGMQRFNTSTGYLEIFDGAVWAVVGGEPTVISDQQFTGDGVTTVYTLTSDQTTNSCLVSINGVVQVPTLAYSVSGTTLTFTEAPAVADHIDVREIATTTTVTGISNTSGNAEVNVTDNNANVNITGNLVVNNGTGFLYGDGTFLTNVGGGNVIATRIAQGTSQANFAGSGGSFYVAVGGANVVNATTGNVAITGDLTPSANATYNLGSPTNQWNALYIKGNTIYIGDGTISSNASGITMTNSGGGSFTVGGTQAGAGNITGGNVTVTGAISTTGTVTGLLLSATGNVTAAANVNAAAVNATNLGGSLTTAAQANVTSVGTLTSLSVSGAVTVAGGIVNGAGNAVSNIGSSSNYFNTVFAQATSALYADLAEKYVADAEYAPGTVVAFGGESEVTASTANADRRVAGVVSTNPSYIMNGGLEGTNVVTVALTGRVPCRVTGTVRKGDLMVSNGDGTARSEENPSVGSVIGKALENFDGATGTIEVVVGRV